MVSKMATHHNPNLMDDTVKDFIALSMNNRIAEQYDLKVEPTSNPGEKDDSGSNIHLYVVRRTVWRDSFAL